METQKRKFKNIQGIFHYLHTINAFGCTYWIEPFTFMQMSYFQSGGRVYVEDKILYHYITAEYYTVGLLMENIYYLINNRTQSTWIPVNRVNNSDLEFDTLSMAISISFIVTGLSLSIFISLKQKILKIIACKNQKLCK